MSVQQLDQYTGNVWTHIISLKREDAARLGYDNANGDIFICSGGCPGVIQRNGIAGLAAGGFFRYGKIAAIIQKRQLPFAAVIIANFKNRVGGFAALITAAGSGGDFAAYGGRCEEDRCQI